MGRKFAVIGLGTFGFQLACELERLGGEVLAIDRDPEVVQEIRDSVSRAVVCDALDRDSLREVGVADVDVVVIGLRSRLDASILATMYVQEMGVEEVVVQATSEDHRRALERLGASRIIFPERDMATRVASHLVAPNIIDCLWVGPGLGLVEVNVPKSFVGKSLVQLNVRQRLGVTVVAIRSPAPAAAAGESEAELAPAFFPTPDYVFRPNDVLIVIGKSDDLKKFPTD